MDSACVKLRFYLRYLYYLIDNKRFLINAASGGEYDPKSFNAETQRHGEHHESS